MQAPCMSRNPEHERIRQVYADRPSEPAEGKYAWWQNDVLVFDTSRKLKFAQLLREYVGAELSDARVLDVGCGNGALLRRLAEWGASPDKLTGIDLLEDRLRRARSLSPNINWQNRSVETLPDAPSFDLITAFTLFSSVLEEAARVTIANEIWKRVRPGGTVIVFDFRYDNPANPNVRRVTQRQLHRWWPDVAQSRYRSLLLAPPLARRLAPLSPTAALLLEALVPSLRSHFLYAARKPFDD